MAMPDFVHAAVRAHLSGLTPADDELLAEVRDRSKADGVPALSPDAAWLLHVLALAASPRRMFEIGTGYGCSGIHLARALSADGILFSVERDPKRAAVARSHFERAGFADRVNVMVGEAARLVYKVAGPFDVIFQDGGKDQYEPLLDRLVDLLRPRGILVSDNILWQGDVLPGFREESAHSPASTKTITKYSRRLADDPRLETVFLPTGDGVAVSVKRDRKAHPQ
jgi:predicted O-methyltransferase YrrM